MSKMPFRQVHLDFHTSPYIPDVGRDFDANEFVNRLKKSHINSITVFAKCHHGYSYYPTKVGTRHPSLQKDLLGEMIEVCHREGIRVPVYTTVVWDELAAENGDWRQVDKAGKLVGRPTLGNRGDGNEDSGWKWLCMNSPYVDYLEEHTKEIVTNYDLDGMFFDIVFQTRPGCLCKYCLLSMKELELNPEDDQDLIKHSLMVERNLMKRMTKVVHSIKPNLPIFYNGRIRIDASIEQGIRPELSNFSHIEIESLPSGFWGYNHFPLYAALYKTLSKEIVGMTGKFHKMWGDFGSLKNQAALEYECFSMIASGAKCSIGDQLHPRGVLDDATYDLIGSVYEQVEEKEPWCVDAIPVDEIGVLTSMNSKGLANQPSSLSDEGVLRILMELQRPFCFLDEESDFSKLKLIIAPDYVQFTEKLKNKVTNYVEKGGSLILSHRSGLDEKGDFAIDFGLVHDGDLEYSPDYIKLSTDFLPEQQNMPYVVYEKGSKVILANKDLEVLGNIHIPYFNRNWEHYMSHFHTPVDRETNHPAAVKKGNIIYLSHPLFKAYRVHGNRIYKQVIKNCINLLINEPMLKTSLPSTAQISIMEQPKSKRKIIHILHYIHQRRADGLDVIEDVIPLNNVKISIKGEKPQKVYLAPQMSELASSYDGDYTTVEIPMVTGHEMVVIE